MKLKTKLSYLLLSSLIFTALPKVFGASCCGGGFAAPSLIVGDDKAQVTTSYAYSYVTAEVGTDSLWHKRDSFETSETFKIEAAHIFQDRWQAGLSIPIIRRSLAEESSSGLGDVSSSIGYEYLPDWDYNPWRPRGLGFLQLTLPTGKSINESDATYQLDSRGRGFWAVGIGTILTKVIGKWDFFSSLDIHRSFNKSYSHSESQGTLKPGYGGNFGLGGGYNLASLRFGGGLTWTHEEPVDVVGTTTSSGSAQRYATATFSASYLFKSELATTLTYSDQTLFGNPTNTSLGRGAMVFIQKRWLR